jgi:cytochrome c oxidase subunit II
MGMNKRRRNFIVSAAALCAGALRIDAFSEPEKKVISVIAKKFEFMPNEIFLKSGETVVLELISQDIVMGFNIPELKKRLDVIPGVVTRLTVTPEKIGKYPFFCDIFCGSGHEDMSGLIIVT